MYKLGEVIKRILDYVSTISNAEKSVEAIQTPRSAQCGRLFQRTPVGHTISMKVLFLYLCPGIHGNRFEFVIEIVLFHFHGRQTGRHGRLSQLPSVGILG